MLSKTQSSVYQNKSSQHFALRGNDANFELIDDKLAPDQKFARTGQRVFGFVKLAAAARDTVISEILRNVATRLASYKDPEGLRVLDELSRNTLSKIDRNMLQTMAPRVDKARRPRIGAAPSQANRSAVAVRSREGVNTFPVGLEVPQLLLAQANEVIE
jgi:hypothetical protein